MLMLYAFHAWKLMNIFASDLYIVFVFICMCVGEWMSGMLLISAFQWGFPLIHWLYTSACIYPQHSIPANSSKYLKILIKYSVELVQRSGFWGGQIKHQHPPTIMCTNVIGVHRQQYSSLFDLHSIGIHIHFNCMFRHGLSCSAVRRIVFNVQCTIVYLCAGHVS